MPTAKPVFVSPGWSWRVRQTEVGDLGSQAGDGTGLARSGQCARRGTLVVGLHQDVGGLEIAMDHSLTMGGVNGQGECADQPRRVIRRPRCAVEPLGQCAAANPLHRDIGAIAQLADFVDLDDVDVLDPGRQLGLALEAKLL